MPSLRHPLKHTVCQYFAWEVVYIVVNAQIGITEGTQVNSIAIQPVYMHIRGIVVSPGLQLRPNTV